MMKPEIGYLNEDWATIATGPASVFNAILDPNVSVDDFTRRLFDATSTGETGIFAGLRRQRSPPAPECWETRPRADLEPSSTPNGDGRSPNSQWGSATRVLVRFLSDLATADHYHVDGLEEKLDIAGRWESRQRDEHAKSLPIVLGDRVNEVFGWPGPIPVKLDVHNHDKVVKLLATAGLPNDVAVSWATFVTFEHERQREHARAHEAVQLEQLGSSVSRLLKADPKLSENPIGSKLMERLLSSELDPLGPGTTSRNGELPRHSLATERLRRLGVFLAAARLRELNPALGEIIDPSAGTSVGELVDRRATELGRLCRDVLERKHREPGATPDPGSGIVFTNRQPGA